MKDIFFITGTDTGVGKTHVACRLLQQAAQAGRQTLGLKPVAAGAQYARNEDALLLQQASTVSLPYAQINPYCFDDPIAPHLAAAKQGAVLSASDIAQHVQQVIATTSADYVVIEGAGGWLVPLNERETLADVACRLNVPVILVVGMKLGCLNHALLTASAIRDDGLTLAGWVANAWGQPMSALDANIATLEQRLRAPQMRVPYKV